MTPQARVILASYQSAALARLEFAEAAHRAAPIETAALRARLPREMVREERRVEALARYREGA